MFGITDLMTYVLGTIFIILLPGPNSIYVLSVAAQRGMRRGFQGACGVFVGDAVLMLLSAMGVASVLKTTPLLFLLLKYVGAVYLAWLGVQMLVSSWRRWRQTDTLSSQVAQVDDSHPFRKALLISLLNPKAILFFISFFVQFVDPAYAYPALTFTMLGLIAQSCSMLYLSAVILIGARVADAFRSRQRLSASLGGSVGALFLGFSAKLATASAN
ncbi:leucine efflux protein LeuE [Chitinimonas sp. PSY-7]|uniref:leucine efflux protein LeuE n=1 Tax=Chitinimonas sp. PSY-7 TaxID=3459088 RepID=UPI00403FF039